MQSLKRVIAEALERNDLGGVAGLAQQERKVVSLLVRCAYAKDTLAGQRAIRAMGVVAKELVRAKSR